MYELKLKKTKAGKYRVCLVSSDNGKLVLQGEPMQRGKDALDVLNKLRDGYNDKRSIMPVYPAETLPADHRFPKNSGPKKKPNKK